MLCLSWLCGSNAAGSSTVRQLRFRTRPEQKQKSSLAAGVWHQFREDCWITGVVSSEVQPPLGPPFGFLSPGCVVLLILGRRRLCFLCAKGIQQLPASQSPHTRSSCCVLSCSGLRGFGSDRVRSPVRTL